MSEQNPWAAIQYRGDAQDIKEMFESYNIAGYLQANYAEENARGDSFRSRLLKDAVLLNETLSPRIFGIVNKMSQQLGLKFNYEIFCVRDQTINAFAYHSSVSNEPNYLIGITSAALEGLEDEEIAFLLGHEFGHFIFGHNALLRLQNPDPENPNLTVLPYLGECLFMRWRKKGEISADRIGLIACGSFEAAGRALVKAGFGLSDRNLNLNLETLLSQIEEIKDKPEIMEAVFQSHPLLPLRLKTLHLFSKVLVDFEEAALAPVENQIDELLACMKRYPRKPAHVAVMRLVALGGMEILAADKDLDEEEIRILIYLLHKFFTDEPEKEILIEAAERKQRWEEALKLINEEGDPSDGQFIVSRLADIALADGKLLDQEAMAIIQIAERLDIPAKQAYSIIIRAAQVVGFNVDNQMKTLVKTVRQQLKDNMCSSLMA